MQERSLTLKEARDVARSSLWYPSVYVILTVPLSIARFADIVSHPWSETFICAAMYCCEGLCNVLLCTSLRPGLFHGPSWDGGTKFPDCVQAITREGKSFSWKTLHRNWCSLRKRHRRNHLLQGSMIHITAIPLSNQVIL